MNTKCSGCGQSEFPPDRQVRWLKESVDAAGKNAQKGTFTKHLGDGTQIDGYFTIGSDPVDIRCQSCAKKDPKATSFEVAQDIQPQYTADSVYIGRFWRCKVEHVPREWLPVDTSVRSIVRRKFNNSVRNGQAKRVNTGHQRSILPLGGRLQ
jgi:hypothetical protein